MKKMTALTYIDNNSTFRHVVSTGVDRAEGGGQMWRNYWEVSRMWQSVTRGREG